MVAKYRNRTNLINEIVLTLSLYLAWLDDYGRHASDCQSSVKKCLTRPVLIGLVVGMSVRVGRHQSGDWHWSRMSSLLGERPGHILLDWLIGTERGASRRSSGEWEREISERVVRCRGYPGL
jgi:hypothetical protein